MRSATRSSSRSSCTRSCAGRRPGPRPAGQCAAWGSTAQVISPPQHPDTQKLVNCRPVRDVAPPGAGRVVEARDVRVEYPTRLPGIRGWFMSGRFTAVQGVDFDLAPGETLGIVGES